MPVKKPNPEVPAFDVLVCGSLHLDIVVRTQSLPRIDETAPGSSWHQVCGGKGGNQVVQAARHGAKTAMIGRVGQDAFGETLLKNLQVVGVDASSVRVDPVHASGMSVAILQANGEYGAVFVSGANQHIETDKLHRDWDALGGAKILVLQNEVPESVNLEAAKIAKARGAKVLLNAAPARMLTEDLGNLIDVLVVNRVEAATLCGRPITDRASALAALPDFASHQKSVVITLGAMGLVVQEGMTPPIEIAALKVNVTSTHGAGDCFVGVLAAQLAQGAPLAEACRHANAKSAEFVSRPHQIK